jgi:hypothetical protein
LLNPTIRRSKVVRERLSSVGAPACRTSPMSPNENSQSYDATATEPPGGLETIRRSPAFRYAAVAICGIGLAAAGSTFLRLSQGWPQPPAPAAEGRSDGLPNVAQAPASSAQNPANRAEGQPQLPAPAAGTRSEPAPNVAQAPAPSDSPSAIASAAPPAPGAGGPAGDRLARRARRTPPQRTIPGGRSAMQRPRVSRSRPALMHVSRRARGRVPLARHRRSLEIVPPPCRARSNRRPTHGAPKRLLCRTPQRPSQGPCQPSRQTSPPCPSRPRIQPRRSRPAPSPPLRPARERVRGGRPLPAVTCPPPSCARGFDGWQGSAPLRSRKLPPRRGRRPRHDRASRLQNRSVQCVLSPRPSRRRKGSARPGARTHGRAFRGQSLPVPHVPLPRRSGRRKRSARPGARTAGRARPDGPDMPVRPIHRPTPNRRRCKPRLASSAGCRHRPELRRTSGPTVSPRMGGA